MWLKDNGVNPQIIIYTKEYADTYKQLIQSKILSAISFAVLVVVGKGEDSFNNIEQIIDTIKEFSKSIMLCGFAQLEHKVIDYSLKNNFDIRIGFENNLTNFNGELATNNQERVQEVLKNIPNLESLQVSINKLTPNWL